MDVCVGVCVVCVRVDVCVGVCGRVCLGLGLGLAWPLDVHLNSPATLPRLNRTPLFVSRGEPSP